VDCRYGGGERFGNLIDTISSVALIGFGLWIVTTAWVSEHHQHSHQHPHSHDGPLADHQQKGGNQKGRTALMLILGSSPMIEGIPAFFAAGKYGVHLISAMSVVFGVGTIATYVLLCVYSTVGLRRIRLDVFERHGEALSGAAIVLVGLAFWLWPFR
jgi:nickel/cobalt transporter (NicO) family protein